ncbi:RagB/SusD family nutrient uptake outer membrane protein [Wenyingzhuangia sp. 2_MG-2023]|uniref:RagB/SusD family nutrient uptake outer membrane protein n=1 Tax=Wenyingzhuangia sp. 2_MG-2023 TaxID=3062639 RepID=UPI0026E3A5B7|nr:RagB/SusD family nutrient uptake outer membrane protein [Wenyingzhuangia sp. 2_MG-2023]MDO6737772.1 RagB/SusD family nutrient uptake outer membrane protein [Wenyingzhuangia sp. 2_MG-2023]
MKNNFIKYTLIALATLQVACSFDPEIDNTYSEDWVFSQPDYVEGLLLNAYGNLPNTIVDGYGGDFLDAATDNAVTNNESGVYRLGTGGLTPSSNVIGQWDNAYNQIRNVHLFMENGLGDNINYDISSEAADKAKRDNLKGEAFYLRAWWSFQLLQAYGGKTAEGEALGYPIVLRSATKEESTDLEAVKRNTYEACVIQIKKDIDSAMLYLPSKYTGNDPVTGINNLGRADQQVSLALKSRVSLYAASPAYQPDNIVKLVGMGQFNVVDETAYINKWKIAADDAQEAINEIGTFTSLKTSDFDSNNTPAEFIWRSFFTSSALENSNYPIAERGGARTGPSQNLVNAFYTKTGYPIDDSRSGYDADNPYDNRDPRLYVNVLYNGSDFNNRYLETYVGGIDSKEKYSGNTRTGYYVRKWLSLAPGIISVDNSSNQRHYNPYFRRTELFLNLAEAANEAYGPISIGGNVTQSSVDIIKSIRTKAGITDNTYVDEIAALGKDEFRKLIQLERRLELAFENHRYFDLRRCLLPLNETVKGIKITQNTDGTFNYEEEDVEERRFNGVRYYYAPLPYDELSKSPNLINNLGW